MDMMYNIKCYQMLGRLRVWWTTPVNTILLKIKISVFPYREKGTSATFMQKIDHSHNIYIEGWI